MTHRPYRLFVFVLAIAGLLGAGCAGVQGEPLGAHYEIEQRFVRAINEDHIGVRVSSGLEGGSLSSAQTGQLAKFFAHALRDSGRFGSVIDLMDRADDSGQDVVVHVRVTKFQVASEQERSQGIRSHLEGEFTLTDRESANRGAAMIRADGMRLEVVGKTRPPDTVKLFSAALLELLR
jgi:hypothetical protein